MLTKAFAFMCFNLLLVFPPLAAQAQQNTPPQIEDFSESSLVIASAKYLGATAESMGEIIDRIFSRYGAPSAIIRGEEISVSVAIGARYGRGNLLFPDGRDYPIYWRGPSLGIDAGGDASKTFTLIYNLNAIDDIYQRFPGVEGSAYFIAGIAVNFQKRGEITLAPMRTGVGVRAGANIGYIRFSEDEKFWKF